MRRTPRSKAPKNRAKNQSLKDTPPVKSPFIEHLYELRRRFMRVAMSVVIFGGIAYAVEQPIVRALLKPAKGQQFIYTSPGGGIDFLFRICLYVGIICSMPVIVYQILKYLEPLIKKNSMRFIAWGSAASGVLAAAGLAFGYFMGLPAALNFLLHQFVTVQIKPLVTIQSYMSFVLVYMFGSALLFQLPLILIFINRIKPLNPRGLFKYERWVILGAFVGSGLMNPTPNILDQLIVAGPIILMYQVGIGIIWFLNRKTEPRRPKEFNSLLAEDEKQREQRLTQFSQARMRIETSVSHQMKPGAVSGIRVVGPIPVRAAPGGQSLMANSSAVSPRQTVTKAIKPAQSARPQSAPKSVTTPAPVRTIASRPHRAVQRRYISDFAVRQRPSRGPGNDIRPQTDQSFA